VPPLLKFDVPGNAPPGPLFGSPERLTLLRSAARILVIDDEEANLRLIGTMLAFAGYRSVVTLSDSRNLEQKLEGLAPDLIILDLHMPGRDGFELLAMLQPWITAEYLPVIVLTGDGSTDSRHRALTAGARDFLTKPFDLTELTLRVRNQLETRLLFQDVKKQNRTLLETIHGRTRELEDARLEMLERLAIAAEYRDDSTSQHTTRVGALSAELGRRLGLNAKETDRMKRAAMMHDVGKIGIPDALLLKPASLTEHERIIMRSHTTIGADILGGSHVPILQLAEEIALSHHERWDGSGYPRGLKREDIPLPGRIVAVADSFDALTNDRPYRRALPLESAMREIERKRAIQFDARVVDALCDIVGQAAP
jgi:cyclic di-GMP phosphodiesterase